MNLSSSSTPPFYFDNKTLEERADLGEFEITLQTWQLFELDLKNNIFFITL